MFAATWAALLLLPAADAGRPVKILARGDWPYLPLHAPAGIGTAGKPHEWVIRSDAELARLSGQTAAITVPKALGAPRIDFARHMLIAVEDGTQPLVGVSGGGPPSAPYTVLITRVEKDPAGRVIVTWKRVPKAPDQGVLTRPLQAVLVEKADGEVKFNRLPDKTEKDPEPVGKELTVVARANWPDGWPPPAPRQEWVIRSEAELIDPRLRAPEPVLERMRVENRARYARALKVPAIDFDKQMIVGVSGGLQPAGSRVEITRVETDPGGEAMTVFWQLHGPKPGETPAGVAHPAEVVLVDRFPGKVNFRPEPAK